MRWSELERPPKEAEGLCILRDTYRGEGGVRPIYHVVSQGEGGRSISYHVILIHVYAQPEMHTNGSIITAKRPKGQFKGDVHCL